MGAFAKLFMGGCCAFNNTETVLTTILFETKKVKIL